MYRRNRVERILDRHLDFIAAAHANDRSKDRRRVSVCPYRFALNKCMSTRCNLERNCVSLVCRIDKRRDRQWRVEVNRARFRDPPANDAGRCHGCSPDRKLASSQHDNVRSCIIGHPVLTAPGFLACTAIRHFHGRLERRVPITFSSRVLQGHEPVALGLGFDL